jgi:hypothetical protein
MTLVKIVLASIRRRNKSNHVSSTSRIEFTRHFSFIRFSNQRIQQQGYAMSRIPTQFDPV